MMEIKNVSWKEVKSYLDNGYTILAGGDAEKANSDGFVILQHINDRKDKDFVILCPTFLRGSLGFSHNGSVSY